MNKQIGSVINSLCSNASLIALSVIFLRSLSIRAISITLSSSSSLCSGFCKKKTSVASSVFPNRDAEFNLGPIDQAIILEVKFLISNTSLNIFITGTSLLFILSKAILTIALFSICGGITSVIKPMPTYGIYLLQTLYSVPVSSSSICSTSKHVFQATAAPHK